MISGYELLEVLHQGRRSVVSRARRSSDGARVVVKALRPEQATAQDGALLRREYEILRRLEGSGAVRAHDLVQQQGGALILEDFGAVSLRWLLLGERLRLADALRVGALLAGAVEAMHRRGVLHGDICPHNVLVGPGLSEVKLCDLSAASLLARQAQEATSPGALRGTLAYMAPEQTGRVNQPVDARSDLYSVGVTLFEALAQRLPFGSSDPLEVVHGHIAHRPPRLTELSSDIPAVVADIVDKLLAKAAEDRYQTAAGLRYDLLEVLRQVEQGSAPASFPLGRRDQPLRLEPPQKLYGRTAELSALLGAWRRVAAGQSGLLLVSGSSGIGKTALVNEVQKPLTEQHGYFVSGKCEQVKRDTPYGPLRQALGALFRQLLAESEDEVSRLRAALDEAWGDGARAFIDLAPEVEPLTGPRPPLPPLGPTESQNRFQTLFDRFLRVFASLKRPLVFFFDDLQWADGGTLTLLEHQLAQPERRYLLVLGAYRPAEVDSTHPLSHAIAALRRAQVRVDEIRLGPLGDAALGSYVADTLRTTPERCAPLARLLQDKTAGNPFFVGQFLRTLREQGLLEFDPERGEWAYDLERVRQEAITDNVVELMVERLRRLPEPARSLVQTAACVGGTFDLGALSLLTGRPGAELLDALGPAIQEGFLLPIRRAGEAMSLLPTTLRFQHDRVHQAAYHLGSADERAVTHLRFGRLLRDGGSRAERLIEIVDQMNLGSALLDDPAERADLAQLNLEAGRKAKASTAYGPALRYFDAGLGLLGPRAEGEHPALWAQLALEHAEARYLTNQLEAAEAAYEELIGSLRSPLERAAAILKKMVLYVTLGRNWDVLALARRGFALLGQRLPDFRDHEAVKQAVAQEFDRVEALLQGHRQRFEASHPGRPFRLDELLDLPPGGDPQQRALLEILVGAIPPASFFGESVFKLVILRMVSLSLEGGAVDTSAFAYALFGHVLASERRAYRAGNDFAQLGLALAERFGSPSYIGKSCYTLGAYVNHWVQHVATSLPLLERAHRLCVEAGELLWAGYAGSVHVWTLDAKGTPLDEVYAEASKHLTFARRTRHEDLTWDTLLMQRAVKALKGESDGPGSFSGDGFDEPREVATMEGLEKKIPLTLYLILKAEVLYLLGRPREALALSRRSESMLWCFAGTIVFSKGYLFHGLILAAAFEDDTEARRSKALAEIDVILERFARWAEACPDNFRAPWLLLRAERARLGGDESAGSLYDQAIEAARSEGFLPLEALANDLAARHHERRGRPRFAYVYLADALSGFRTWGAAAKVRLLEERHPDLRGISWTPASRDADSLARSSDDLGAFIDHQAVLRSVQAISGEIVRPRLLQGLLEVVLQGAGARRAALIVQGPQGPQVEAQLGLGAASVNLDVRSASTEEFPLTLLQYALRSGDDLVLNDARAERSFDDPYLASSGARSVLCLQLRYQGRRGGLLYLDNDLTAGVFTRERLGFLRVLASQAAIALENAALYDRLERHNQELERAVASRTQELSQRNDELRSALRELVEGQQRLHGELNEAAAYVRSLLPPPLVGPVLARWAFLPSAELGGDAFGYQWLDTDHFAVYLLDVCGHGMASALLSISVLTALQSRQLRRADFYEPTLVLSALNEAFPSSAHNGLYFTAWYGVLNVRERTVYYASAGHPPALLLEPGQPPVELGTDGLMLGVMADAPYSAHRRTLAPGARLLVFSDGVYEVQNPAGSLLDYNEFLAQVTRVAATPDPIPDQMVAFARKVRGHELLDDDLSMIEVAI